MTTQMEVTHNVAASRFEARIDGHLCVATYHQHDGVMVMTHTAVPPALQGRGIAAALVAKALESARAGGQRVRPACSYVRSYMRRHADTHDLLERPA